MCALFLYHNPGYFCCISKVALQTAKVPLYAAQVSLYVANVGVYGCGIRELVPSFCFVRLVYAWQGLNSHFDLFLQSEYDQGKY